LDSRPEHSGQLADARAIEHEFELPGLTLAARDWDVGGALPVIALHGWLDNAGSFDLLAPLLAGCRVLALDAAGHGKSGFRSPDAGYNIWQDVRDVFAVADQLGWSRFNLMGHSRGAAIATLAAGTFPSRIERLVLLEGGIPVLGKPSDAPASLARSIVESQARWGSGGRVFPTRAVAIAERCRGFTTINEQAAEILARRSLRAVEGGFQWQVDQRLKAVSELRLTAEHAAAFIDAVTAPVRAFLASVSPFAARPDFRALLQRFRSIEITDLEGGHHFHLEGAEHAIAAEVVKFLHAPNAANMSSDE
jgi:pimeloyl-ACP methyl ester carboxylesterase